MIDLNQLPNHKPGEKVELFLRRHWLVPTRVVLALIAGAVLPFIVFFILQETAPTLLHHPVLTPLLALFASFYFLAIWMLVIQEIVDFYLDTWIVTNERVIDVEQFGLFRREAKECHLENVVDVTSEIHGMLQMIFKYGNVIAQTAGTTGQLNFKEVPQPDEVRQTILKLVDEDRERHKPEGKTPAVASK
ncbi:MAG: PH domain-containing protein [Patescibacteria group bacterium]